MYDHNGQSHISKYETGHYQGGRNVYSDPPRDPYAVTTSALSDVTLSLDAGMLNRGFIPPQTAQPQSGYDTGQEQDLGGFKQQADPYPTPNQTSPMG